MKTQDLKALLKLIVKSSNSAARKYGAHYYEHERNNQWRPCPEPFAVRSAYEEIRKAGYGVTAEAHQGGIWQLGGCGDKLPVDKSKNRYDLAIWPKDNEKPTPLALCEFKWLFGKTGFMNDAENLSKTKTSIGAEAILCLLVAHEDKTKIRNILLERKAELASRHVIRTEATSRIQCGKIYKLGKPTSEREVFFCASAFSLR